MIKAFGKAEFSVRTAIEEQVQFEDMIRWAKRETPPFVPVPGVPGAHESTPASLYVLFRSVLP